MTAVDELSPRAKHAKLSASLLFLNVFVVATCGLIYELLAGALGSYLLGDSVTQFSLVIGLYLSAMGVGAWISRFVERRLAETFLDLELAVALVGGFSVPVLFYAYGELRHFQPVLLGFVFVTGTLVGLELPLLMRLLQNNLPFRDLVSRVLTFDYIGALFAALLFPLLLFPHLGLVRTSLVTGIGNALVGLWGTWLLAPVIGRELRGVRIRAVAVVVLLSCGLLYADRITLLAEDQVYTDEIVYAQTTKHQRLVVTQARSGFHLFINGNLQFASADEYRYHEALVHPAMAAFEARSGQLPRRVMILGGGDGLAAREVLKYGSVQEVVLVDLDPGMTALGERFAPLGVLSRHALKDPRVRVINEDAMIWIASTPGHSYDIAIVDFPDPNNYALGKLYTKRFYHLLRRALGPDGTAVVQSTSPLFARQSYWCVVATMRAAGFETAPFHVLVPSFGEWGYVLAQNPGLVVPTEVAAAVRNDLKFLNGEALRAAFQFSADMTEVLAEVNQLDNQALVRYYEQEWARWQ